MKNVSLKFLEALEKGTKLYQEANIKFADGTELGLTRESFYISGNSYADAAGSSSFPLGSAFGKSVNFSLVNDKDQFSDYDFLMSEITVYCCMDFEDGTTEKILFGTFTVIEPEAYGSIIEVAACDKMYLGDVEYTSNLSFPATAREVLQDSTSTCGVYLLTTTFANDDYIIQEKPEGVTHRDIWGSCAMLAGGNARMDEYNRICIVGYDFSVLDQNGADGGYFDDATPYASGDNVYGGVFDPWDEGDDIDGGTFDEMYRYHVLYKAKNLTVSTDDVVITGIETTEDETEYIYGADGYVISIENPLISGNPQDAVDRIGSLLVGVRFRPFEMDHIAYPVAEFGDVCYLMDRNRNLYQSVITDVNFTFYGYTTIKCTADDPIRNSSKYHSNTTQAVRAARKETKKQIREYDKAVQMLTNLISQSFGVFKSEEVLDDGSVIYYMHNKPTRQESQTIWKMTADAFAVSTDGGLTWNAGMDSEGNAIVNVLSAIGINFEWAKGGTLTLGGENNKDGNMIVNDSSGKQILSIEKNGIVMDMDDGSRIVINPKVGFYQLVGSSRREYHNIFFTEEVSFPAMTDGMSGLTSTIVNLPDEFAGKTAKATVSISEIITNNVPSTFGAVSGCRVSCNVISNNRVQVYGMLNVYDMTYESVYSQNEYLKAVVTVTA